MKRGKGKRTPHVIRYEVVPIEEEEYVTVTLPNGTEQKFEYLMCFEHMGKAYVAFSQVNKETNIMICEGIGDTPDTLELEPVSDPVLLEQLIETFKEFMNELE